MTDISQIEIGTQANIIDYSSPVIKHNMLDIFERMATSEKLKAKTIKVRLAKTEDEKNKFKKDLHGIIVSSNTTTRKKVEGDVHTGFMWADIDKFEGKDNPDKTIKEGVAIVKDLCKDYPYLIGYFISPSGNGIKVLCAIEPDVESHKMSYKAVSDLFDANGLYIDPSCSDAKRICYVCYDPNIRETLIEPLKDWGGERIKPAKKKKVKQYVYKGTNSSDLSPDDEAGLCLQHISPDIDYDEWIRVGMGLKDHGCSCGMWDSWSSGSQLYKQGECERKWASFSGSGVGFGSIVNMAKDGNGGKSPITAAKNQREPIKVTADDFDEIEDEVVDEPKNSITLDNTYYCKGAYLVIESTGKRYIQLNGEAMTRQLRLLGYSNKGADGEMSAVDKFKAYVEINNSIDAFGALAGRSIGRRNDLNTSLRYLVSRKNRRTVAKEGNWDNLRGILEAQYGEEQLQYLYAWMHVSRYQLKCEQLIQGHCLVIAGKVGGGKSCIVVNVIQPLLGEAADAYQYLCKGNKFNGDVLDAELLLIDDKKLGRHMDERETLGNSIKAVVASSSNVKCERKNIDGVNLQPLWRIAIAINDTEKDLGAMPPLGEGEEDTVGDKVLLLKCNQVGLPFVGDKDQFAKVGKLIAADIEAFAYFIDNYKIPESIKVDKTDLRFGFNRFHNPDLLAVLNQNSNDRTLLSVTDRVFFDSDFYAEGFRLDIHQESQRRYWRGKASQWSKFLLQSRDIPHKVKSTVEGELGFGDSAVKAGLKLKSIAEISKGRVVRDKGGERLWTIWEREDV